MVLEDGIARRGVLGALAGAGMCAALPTSLHATPLSRRRVIIDNDFSGDPDGLFQLAHHLLSPSVQIPCIIGSHIHVRDFLDGSTHQADNAAERVRELLAAMRLEATPQVLAGRNAAIGPGSTPAKADTSDRIIAEAMRDDTGVPLVYAAGAGLTELAAALRIAPEIGSRIRLAWIGGMEWPELTPAHLHRTDPEYNTTIDIGAVQTVFNHSEVEIWQVPRNVYRQMLVSMPELRLRLRSAGPAGAFLLDALDRVRHNFPDEMGETYILGDSPLVTLTALLSAFEPDTSSSDYVVRPTPTISDEGKYVFGKEGRPMRVYRSIDTRLTFSDMFAKLAAAEGYAATRTGK